ncbi:MAG TPA: hypothetical protein ENI23_11510 [bacterium]|nr:hypothetical protein [bacterium]
MSDPNEKAFPLDNLGAIQRKTNRFQSRDEDAWLTQNVDTTEIGSVKKKQGYAKRGSTLTSTTSTSSSTSTTTTSTSTSTSTSTTTSTSTS